MLSCKNLYNYTIKIVHILTIFIKLPILIFFPYKFLAFLSLDLNIYLSFKENKTMKTEQDSYDQLLSCSYSSKSCKRQVPWKDYICKSLHILAFTALRHREMTISSITPLTQLWWRLPVTYFLPNLKSLFSSIFTLISFHRLFWFPTLP